jgi:uracil phosphoribosyltransferase
MAILEATHPLIKDKLSRLRDKNTNMKEFRRLLEEVSNLLAYEATRDLITQVISVSTPVADAELEVLKRHVVVAVPILRAGLAMLPGIMSLLSDIRIGVLGIHRNEETLMPISYYQKFPEGIESKSFIILDPMLATGGTMIDAVNIIKKKKPVAIKALCLIASKHGIARFSEAHPDVNLYVAAIDEGLNEMGYIVPGLGDAGDRYFGTEEE